MDRATLAQQIYTIANIRGEFKLRSGATSDQYFDKYRFEAQPTLLKAIAEHMAALVPAGTEVIAGLEMGGIPLATMLSQITQIPTAFIRKEAKSYGTCQFAEGTDIRGKKVLMIEDVVTSGGQVILSATDLRSLDAKLGCVLCVIDREQGGREKIANADLELKALFTRTELETAAGI